MKLNHLNLTVTDVPETRRLFETYFGLKGLEEGGDENFDAVFDDEGSVITLMRHDEVSYPKTFHLGFIQESEERVNEINLRLKEDGFDVKPPKRFHGSWTFYFRPPGGFMIDGSLLIHDCSEELARQVKEGARRMSMPCGSTGVLGRELRNGMCT